MGVLWAHVNAPPPSLTAHRFDLSPAVDQVLGRALAKDPAARYASCGAFADALRTALGVGPYSVPPPAHPRHPAHGELPAPAQGAPAGRSAHGTRQRLKPRGGRRGVLAATSVAAVLASVAVVAAVLFYPGSGKQRQISDGGPAGRATGRSASPNATVPATG